MPYPEYWDIKERAWRPAGGPSVVLVDSPKVVVSVDSSVASGASNAVSWGTPLRDTHGFWSSGQPTRFTIPAGQGGDYEAVAAIGGQLSGTPAAGSYYHLLVYKNGVNIGIDAHMLYEGQWAYPNQRIVIPLPALVPGDYIQIYVTNYGSGYTYNYTCRASLTRLASGTPGPQGPPGVNGAPGADGVGTSPSGSIMAFGSTTPPSGWLLCDGTAVSRTTYAALFAVIGTTYGAGDGSTTFNLPNLKGRAIVGYNSADTDFDTLGETGGAKTSTPSAHAGSAVGDHSGLTNNHSGGSVSNESSHSHNVTGGTGGPSSVSVADFGAAWNPANSDHYHNFNVTSGAGSSHGHTTTQPSAHGAISAHSVTQPSAHSAMSVVQPYMAIPYIIKT